MGTCQPDGWLIDGLEIASAATASLAAKALATVLNRLPFTAKAIQVDGGSEFMAEFETFCQEGRLRLFVLPPRSPKPQRRRGARQPHPPEEVYELYGSGRSLPSGPSCWPGRWSTTPSGHTKPWAISRPNSGWPSTRLTQKAA